MRRVVLRGWRASARRKAPKTSPGGWRSRAPSPAMWARVWSNISRGRCRTRRRWRSRGTWRGFSRPTRATGWRGWRRRGRRRHWRRFARRWKRRWGCASRASAAHASSVRPWCRRCSTACSPPGCCGRARRRRPRAGSTGARRSGICARRCSRRCSSSYRSPVGCNRWGWWKCWTGRRQRWTGWTARRSSRASTRARRCPTSTNRSWKPSIPNCASNSASGTRRRKWCATWSPAWTGH